MPRTIAQNLSVTQKIVSTVPKPKGTGTINPNKKGRK